MNVHLRPTKGVLRIASALEEAGLDVHSCSPRSVADVGPALEALARVVSVDPGDRRSDPDPPPLGLRAFVPIWRRPWMSLAAGTYGSSVLERVGVENVFAGHPDRYPQVTLEEASALGPDLVVLPDEPYPFGPRHHAELAAVAPIVPVDGQDLFWWGVRTPEAIRRLHRAIGASTRGGGTDAPTR